MKSSFSSILNRLSIFSGEQKLSLAWLGFMMGWWETWKFPLGIIEPLAIPQSDSLLMEVLFFRSAE